MVQDLTPTSSHPTTFKPQLYGRRKGRPLRTTKQQLWDELLPRVVFQLPETPHCINLLDLYNQQSFSKDASFIPKEFWLEIGFGGGEHLAQQALHNPTVGVIGCEAFVNGIASALFHIHTHNISNLRIFPQDVRLLLSHLPDESISRIFILFPDPWPKARHHKRRLINAHLINALARILKPGGELRLATDDTSYAEEMVQLLRDDPRFTGPSELSTQWQTPPHDWHPTRYEQRGKKAGRACYYFMYKLSVSRPNEPKANAEPGSSR